MTVEELSVKIKLENETELKASLDGIIQQLNEVLDKTERVQAVLNLAPVVRCFACEKYKPFSNVGYGVCRVFGHTMKDADFCSYGKEKEK